MNEVNPLVVMSIQLTQFSQPKKKEPGKNPVGLEGEEKKPCRLPTSLSFVLSSLFVLEKKGKKPKKMLEKKTSGMWFSSERNHVPFHLFLFPFHNNSDNYNGSNSSNGSNNNSSNTRKSNESRRWWQADRPSPFVLFFFLLSDSRIEL